MSNKVKDIDIKNCSYYIFSDIIDIKKFDLNNIKIEENSWICGDKRLAIHKYL